MATTSAARAARFCALGTAGWLSYDLHAADQRAVRQRDVDALLPGFLVLKYQRATAEPISSLRRGGAELIFRRSASVQPCEIAVFGAQRSAEPTVELIAQLPAGRGWGSRALSLLRLTHDLGNRSPRQVRAAASCAMAPAPASIRFSVRPGEAEEPARMFTSLLAHDREGRQFQTDNGQHQVMKLDQNGQILLTFGKKGRGLRRQR
jgi:hypothetical protein